MKTLLIIALTVSVKLFALSVFPEQTTLAINIALQKLNFKIVALDAPLEEVENNESPNYQISDQFKVESPTKIESIESELFSDIERDTPIEQLFDAQVASLENPPLTQGCTQEDKVARYQCKKEVIKNQLWGRPE